MPNQPQRRGDFAIVIMAAGKGTRLKSKRPKVLHEIGGQPLLAHVITAAKQVADPRDIYVVVGHEAERVRGAVEQSGVGFILQKDNRGTGHPATSPRDPPPGPPGALCLPAAVPPIPA